MMSVFRDEIRVVQESDSNCIVRALPDWELAPTVAPTAVFRTKFCESHFGFMIFSVRKLIRRAATRGNNNSNDRFEK